MSVAQHIGTIWKMAGNENVGIVIIDEEFIKQGGSVKTIVDISRKAAGNNVTLSNVVFHESPRSRIDYSKKEGNWAKIDLRLFEQETVNPVVDFSADFEPGSAGTKYIFIQRDGTQKELVVGEAVSDWGGTVFSGTWYIDNGMLIAPGQTYWRLAKMEDDLSDYGFRVRPIANI